MRFLILTRGRTLYSTRRLKEVARRRGHDVRLVDPHQCILSIGDAGPELVVEGVRMEQPDGVIARVGSSTSDMVINLLAHFEATGAACINAAEGVRLSRDKFRSLQELARHGLPIPRTVMTRDPDHLDDAIRSLGSLPVIIKTREGTQGVGVMKADSLSSARSIVHAMWAVEQTVILQEFIAESQGSDIRVFVVGDKVMGAMKRNANPGDFRSNLHRGGRAERITLSRETRDLAITAAEKLNLHVAGVDLLMSHRGPLITEVNPSPGLEGIEGVTGVDVARAIIRALEQLASPGAHIPEPAPPLSRFAAPASTIESAKRALLSTMGLRPVASAPTPPTPHLPPPAALPPEHDPDR